MSLALPVALAVLVALLVVNHATQTSRALEWMVKPLASACFVLAAALGGAQETGFGEALIAGLVLAALGDVLLIAKTDRRAFALGLAAFLGAHVAYAAAFCIRGFDPLATAGSALAAAIASVVVVRWLWPHLQRSWRAPVLGYVVAIGAMVALAIGTFVERGDPRLAIGAIGFYASDLAVARERFVRKSAVNRAWGLPVYYASQMLLASAAGDR